MELKIGASYRRKPTGPAHRSPPVVTIKGDAMKRPYLWASDGNWYAPDGSYVFYSPKRGFYTADKPNWRDLVEEVPTP